MRTSPVSASPFLLALVAVLLLAQDVFAQAVPLPSGGGRRPTPVAPAPATEASPSPARTEADAPPVAPAAAPPAAAPLAAAPPAVATAPARAATDNPRRTLPVNPSRPTYSDNAGFIVPGWVEMELGYSAAFNSCPTVTLDPVTGLTTAQDGTCALQAVQALAKWSPVANQEYRVGWDAFGSLGLPGDDSIRGVGDVYVQGKFGIPLDIMEPERHRLAILGEVRPGFGQQPVTQPGLSLGAWAVYSTFPGVFQVHAQAGLRATGLFDEFGLQLPLSAVFGYSPITDLVVFGEFVEILQLDSLQRSQTQLLAGVAWSPISSVMLDLSGGVGLTETVPAGLFQIGLTFLALPIQ